MISNTCYRRATLLALAFLVVGGAVSSFADTGHERKAKKTLLESSVATYQILQGEATVGSETVTHEVWGDNSVVYKSVIGMSLAEGARWDQTTELVLDEESYFPRSYSMTKLMVYGEQKVEQSASVRMVANVAVISTRISGSESKQNVVVPAGTSFNETGVMHLIHQLLFWYDADVAGRQTFTFLDVSRGQTEDVVLHKGERETIEVNGETIEVDTFALERSTVTQRYFVDDDGRIVRADFGYIVYSLSDWTRRDRQEG